MAESTGGGGETGEAKARPGRLLAGVEGAVRRWIRPRARRVRPRQRRDERGASCAGCGRAWWREGGREGGDEQMACAHE